jgi:hypothetical protein
MDEWISTIKFNDDENKFGVCLYGLIILDDEHERW